MRTLYLIRHGEVDLGGEKRCIGRTELDLSSRGLRQGEDLARYFDGVELDALYASPARRATATAERLSEGRWPVRVSPALWELDMGAWDGKTFREIRAADPDLYERRGREPDTVVPPGGERPADAQARMGEGVRDILAAHEGNVAVVAHAGVNRLLLCQMEDIPLRRWLSLPQPYGCLNVIHIGPQSAQVAALGRMPRTAPDRQECQRMLRQRGTPDQVIDHCVAVRCKADELCSALWAGGPSLDRRLILASALLHDIARHQPDHAETGGNWLLAEGYPQVADIIAQHHQLRCPGALDEAAVVFLADKLVQGDRQVTLEERFAASRQRCRDQDALAAHDLRYFQAMEVWSLYRAAAGENR